MPLQYRLDKAIEYFSKNPNVIIIVSGAQGPGEDITEALAMERYLKARGIPEEHIIKEEQSTSTLENCTYSKQILDAYFPAGYRAAVITNKFHIYRTVMVAKRVGLPVTHIGAFIQWYNYSITYLREFAAVMKLWIF
jgi:uncharacterized SAM-binding protein YcdF (DUF218 family)